MTWAGAAVILLRGAASAPVQGSGPGEAGGHPAGRRDRAAARGYGALAVLGAVSAALAQAPWWLVTAGALGLAAVTLAGLLWRRAAEEAPVAVPILAATATTLLVWTLLTDPLSHLQLGRTPVSEPSVLGYVWSVALFLVLTALVLWGARFWSGDGGLDAKEQAVARRMLLRTGLGGAALASLRPLITAQQHVVPAAAWSVPLMHLCLIAAAGTRTRLRRAAALVLPLVVPLSGLWAYSMSATPGSTAVAVTLTVMFAGILLAEVLLTVVHPSAALTTVHYAIAGALTLLLSLVALIGSGLFLQLAGLGAAAVLLTAGLLRGQRLGVYWGASVIVISILWSLRSVMFLFLVALGALIIGAAIWRLVGGAEEAIRRHTPGLAPLIRSVAL
ncbi:hypothetical protein [Nesterenkonia flava]|uniref:DUF2157 domain-containing protein n=1 Tax=Nesterenkonia flava TaxID=469799 RepID=A0ABU1FUW4_9MICC|nr:hypothetical protein [Nesterenkonia flava]MDR5712441.1 hypothetical protein [Nesterenkonia flava]